MIYKLLMRLLTMVGAVKWALGDGDTWDEATPTNATIATTIDDYNRDLRIGIRSRMAFEHEWPDSQSATAEGGKHKYITLQMQTGNPGIAGTQTGAVFQMTNGTSADALIYVNAATQDVNVSDRVYFWYLAGDAETGANVSSTLRLLSSGTPKIARAYCSTTASGGDGIQVDILYDGNSVWTSTANQLILAPGSTSTSVGTFATSGWAAGGLLTIDVDKVGTGTAGGNVTVMVEVG